MGVTQAAGLSLRWFRDQLAAGTSYDDLVSEAQRLTGTIEKSALVRQALRALIERESARRLAQLGASQTGLEEIPRRQTPA